MAGQILAAVGLTICLMLALRLLLSRPRQRRFDAAARHAWIRLRQYLYALWHWRRHRRDAELAAREAIARADRRSRGADGNWDGNVYQAKSFRKPRKPH